MSSIESNVRSTIVSRFIIREYIKWNINASSYFFIFISSTYALVNSNIVGNFSWDLKFLFKESEYSGLSKE